jgi:hypothetical protein
MVYSTDASTLQTSRTLREASVHIFLDMTVLVAVQALQMAIGEFNCASPPRQRAYVYLFEIEVWDHLFNLPRRCAARPNPSFLHRLRRPLPSPSAPSSVARRRSLTRTRRRGCLRVRAHSRPHDRYERNRDLTRRRGPSQLVVPLATFRVGRVNRLLSDAQSRDVLDPKVSLAAAWRRPPA